MLIYLHNNAPVAKLSRLISCFDRLFDFPRGLSSSSPRREDTPARARSQLIEAPPSLWIDVDVCPIRFQESTFLMALDQSRCGEGVAYANVLAGETQRFIHLLPERRRGELTRRLLHIEDQLRTQALPRREETFSKALFFFFSTVSGPLSVHFLFLVFF